MVGQVIGGYYRSPDHGLVPRSHPVPPSHRFAGSKSSALDPRPARRAAEKKGPTDSGAGPTEMSGPSRTVPGPGAAGNRPIPAVCLGSTNGSRDSHPAPCDTPPQWNFSAFLHSSRGFPASTGVLRPTWTTTPPSPSVASPPPLILLARRKCIHITPPNKATPGMTTASNRHFNYCECRVAEDGAVWRVALHLPPF